YVLLRLNRTTTERNRQHLPRHRRRHYVQHERIRPRGPDPEASTRRTARVRNVSDRTFPSCTWRQASVELTVMLRNRDDLGHLHLGVARVCMAISAGTRRTRGRLTIKRNTVAVVTDGTAVLSPAIIGPAAALPVMEGQGGALFKQFAGVDAWPVCPDTTDTEQDHLPSSCATAPSYGGVNLEGASPRRAARGPSGGCGGARTSRCSTTTSTAPRSSCWQRPPTRWWVVGKKIGDVRIVVAVSAQRATRSSSCCTRRAPATSWSATDTGDPRGPDPRASATRTGSPRTPTRGAHRHSQGGSRAPTSSSAVRAQPARR
ncbi:hypothetical protein HBB16_07235, partial [Pseudonocardia sp. MCCB 268]|nr:hypothetical protein [Pseudonocardia cytotoxica]